MTVLLNTLTEYEKLAVTGQINLSDGHARIPPSAEQAACIDVFRTRLIEGGAPSIQDAEDRFLFNHFSLAGQSRGHSISRSRSFICHSASAACEVVGNYLRLRHLGVTLVHPTFDNIPNILRRHGIPVFPVSDELMIGGEIVRFLLTTDIQALFLVLPNNPTGTSISSDLFERIVNICRSKGVLLIIDFAFRLYDRRLEQWDQYEVLEESGVSYLAMEDTGKVWPTDDLKVGVLKASKDLSRAIDHIHDDFLLNVSGSLLELLADLSQAALHVGLDSSVRDPIAAKCGVAREITERAGLKWLNSLESFSVAWLDSGSDNGAAFLYRYCVERGVHILPGNLFYWDNSRRGGRYIRIALARPMDTLIRGSRIVAEAFQARPISVEQTTISLSQRTYRR